jgi:ribosomal protein L29
MAEKKQAKEAEIVTDVKKSAKKVTKKAQATSSATAKAVKASVKNLRELSESDLHAKLAELRGDLTGFQKMARANELPSSHVIRKTRKEIARVHTILTEKLSKEKEDE